MTPQFPRRSVFLILGLFVLALLYALAPSSAYACTGVVEATPSGSGGVIPPEGPTAGTALTVSGSGFVAGVPVVLHWGASDGPELGRTVSDSKGTFSLETVVPDVTGSPPRIIAVSTEASSNGMPTTGWVDLGSSEPVTAAPADRTAATEPADERRVTDVVPGDIGVLLLGVVLAVLTAVRRRTTSATGDGGACLDGSDDLDRELTHLLEPAAVPGTENARSGHAGRPDEM